MVLNTWEYKRQGITDETGLNKLGAEGWELVTYSVNGYIFKRLKGTTNTRMK